MIASSKCMGVAANWHGYYIAFDASNGDNLRPQRPRVTA
jgi:hypothetical protein